MSPVFVPLLHVQIQMFVNATFDIVPCSFYQCIIIKLFDAHFQIFIPVAWIFLADKTNDCIWQAFNWLTSAVNTIAVAYVGVDFERAFFSQVSNHFSGAQLIG